VHAAFLTRTLRGALLAAAPALVLAACEGETTEPVTPYPYDIIFERRDGQTGRPDLYRLDLETGDAIRVFTSGSVGGMHPSARPGGSQIAFVRTDAEFNSEVFIVNRDGTGLVNITSSSAVDEMPTWAPNGQRIAFVTDREGSFRDIFVVNTNGTNLSRLTPTDPFPAVTSELWPAWSPDGRLVAYSSTIDGTPDIWTITVDETPVQRVRLTGTADIDEHPTWSPVDAPPPRIAFHRIDVNTGDADIVILNLSTGTLQTISMPGQQLWPSWSPEGDLIAFSSNHETDDFEIYTMRPDGTEVVRRTDSPLNDLRPTWLIRPVQP
jgi:Tol biopolymer transport system component